MAYIVTGGAGFIGSCVVAALNDMGFDDIVVVDHLSKCVDHAAFLRHCSYEFKQPSDDKIFNVKDKKISRFVDKKIFIDSVRKSQESTNVKAIIHMGACSSTTLMDKEYYWSNNFEYTRDLFLWAHQYDIPFIYASSAATYGGGEYGYRDDVATIKKCQPLNFYGESKQQFDQWVLDHNHLNDVVGLKFFNVFGPNEYHKGDMRSVIAKQFSQVMEKGVLRLFRSYKEGYSDGEQTRDFIYVKDVVKVIQFFLNHPDIHGIFNVGTGRSRSWNDVAKALFAAIGRDCQIEYIDMPETLRSRYQYHTEAIMDQLRAVGFSAPFMSLEDSVADYVKHLSVHSYM